MNSRKMFEEIIRSVDRQYIKRNPLSWKYVQEEYGCCEDTARKVANMVNKWA